jgi:predicted nicotinamide N-methyase
LLTSSAVLDLPQLYTKPSAESLLHTLKLLTSAPRTWDRRTGEDDDAIHGGDRERGFGAQSLQVNPEGVTRYLTSIVSSDLRWIDDDDAKEEIWNQASARMSERSGRSAMGALSRTFRIPSSTGSFELDIHEPALTGDDIGLKTWAASYMLAKRLHTLNLVQPNAQQRLQVLELGSGTGLVGMAMAGLGADVVLTDMASIHANLMRNAEHNVATIEQGGGSARTGILDWTNPTVCELFPDIVVATKSTIISSKFLLILAADSLYSPEHPHMLVDTISMWLSDEADAKVIVEFPYRDAYLPEIATFRDRMTKLGLRILEEGEEKGYDDWGSRGANGDRNDDEDSVVTCWWSIWAIQPNIDAST